jgi:hypothetical protein
MFFYNYTNNQVAKLMNWIKNLDTLFIIHKDEMRNAIKIVVGKLEGKRPFGSSRRVWQDHIKIDLRWVGREDVVGFIWFRVTPSGTETSSVTNC